jgi:hypothetical protein
VFTSPSDGVAAGASIDDVLVGLASADTEEVVSSVGVVVDVEPSGRPAGVGPSAGGSFAGGSGEAPAGEGDVAPGVLRGPGAFCESSGAGIMRR